jgi:hypothetical protein
MYLPLFRILFLLMVTYVPVNKSVAYTLGCYRTGSSKARTIVPSSTSVVPAGYTLPRNGRIGKLEIWLQAGLRSTDLNEAAGAADTA